MDKLIASKPLRLTVFVIMVSLISVVGYSGYVTGQKKLDCTPQPSLDRNSFQLVMRTIAEAWNRGDARDAASCFAENAIYSGPPAVPRRGREALFQYFGGAKGRGGPMHMTWHQLVFDPVQQIGVGEYTFQHKIQTHGLVIVRISNGLILNWREYEVESTLSWEQFVGENRF